MASPYRPAVIAGRVVVPYELPPGETTIPEADLLALQEIIAADPFAWEAAIIALQVKFPIKALEPSCAGGEILFTVEGDVVMDFAEYDYVT